MKAKKQAALKVEPGYCNPVLALVDGLIVMDRLDDVGSEGYNRLTSEEAQAEREQRQRAYWQRWQRHLRQEQQDRRA